MQKNLDDMAIKTHNLHPQMPVYHAPKPCYFDFRKLKIIASMHIYGLLNYLLCQENKILSVAILEFLNIDCYIEYFRVLSKSLSPENFY